MTLEEQIIALKHLIAELAEYADHRKHCALKAENPIAGRICRRICTCGLEEFQHKVDQ